MGRSFVLEIEGDGGGTQVNPIPVTRVKINVAWTMEGNLKDIVGYNVCLTTPSGSPLNATSVRYSTFVQNPSARDYTFEDVLVGDWVGWVQSVAPGADSKWMASTTISVADDGYPSVRGSDDRNIQAFCEDFRSASLPTGFTVNNGAYSLAAESGKIRLEPNHATNPIELVWDVEAWIDAYLDPSAKRGGKAVVIMRLKFGSALDPPTTPKVTVKNSTGGTVTLYADSWGSTPKADGFHHHYRVEVGQEVTTIGTNSAIVTLFPGYNSSQSNGDYIWLDAIALGFDNFDNALDGEVNKGVTANDQFGIDTGGGYFLVSPVRPAGAGSSQLVIDENGVFWLRDESGNLITEHGYKFGRQGATTGAPGGTEVPWDDDTYLDPIIPLPDVTNKLRLAFERRGGTVWQTPTYSPVRVYLEATHHQTTGFRIQHLNIEGVADANIAQLQKDMTAITAAKGHDEITLNESDEFGTGSGNASDAFWENKNDAAMPFTSAYYSFRQVAWIQVVMPTSKKADGSYYYCDLKFIVKYGDIISYSLGGGAYSYTLGTEYETLSSVIFRCFADGRTWRIPIVIGKANPPFIMGGTAAINYNRQGLAVRWRLRTVESGAGSGAYPTAVSMPRADVDYYANASTTQCLYGQQNLNYLYLQEY